MLRTRIMKTASQWLCYQLIRQELCKQLIDDYVFRWFDKDCVNSWSRIKLSADRARNNLINNHVIRWSCRVECKQLIKNYVIRWSCKSYVNSWSRIMLSDDRAKVMWTANKGLFYQLIPSRKMCGCRDRWWFRLRFAQGNAQDLSK